MNDTIPLSEKIYLLAIHPEKGGIVSASYTAMDYILPGTLFMELYQKGHIRFDDKRIILVNQNSKNEIHRFLLNKFGQAKKPLKISRWINKLYFSQKYIKRSVQQGLVNKRIIKMEKKRFLIFKWRKPVIIKKPFVFSLRNEIENKVFGGTLSESDVILLSFLKPSGLLRQLFPDREKRKRARKNLDKMMVENQVSRAVADAISAAQAVAASVAATTVTTAATS